MDTKPFYPVEHILPNAWLLTWLPQYSSRFWSLAALICSHSTTRASQSTFQFIFRSDDASCASLCVHFMYNILLKQESYFPKLQRSYHKHTLKYQSVCCSTEISLIEIKQSKRQTPDQKYTDNTHTFGHVM